MPVQAGGPHRAIDERVTGRQGAKVHARVVGREDAALTGPQGLLQQIVQQGRYRRRQALS
jgi:hypothetical protein